MSRDLDELFEREQLRASDPRSCAFAAMHELAEADDCAKGSDMGRYHVQRAIAYSLLGLLNTKKIGVD